MARLVPEGWCVQAFRFTLNHPDASCQLGAPFCSRRAFNWTVTALSRPSRADGTESALLAAGVARPVEHGQHQVYHRIRQVCGRMLKEAYADGIAGAVDAY